MLKKADISQSILNFANCSKQKETFEEGDDIFTDGQVGHDMYIISEGEVEIYKNENGVSKKIAIRGPLEFIGEMALFLEDNKRTAGVRATKKTVAHRFTREHAIRWISLNHQYAIALIYKLCERLKEATAHRVQGADHKKELEELKHERDMAWHTIKDLVGRDPFCKVFVPEPVLERMREAGLNIE